jgi:hypothetical protein
MTTIKKLTQNTAVNDDDLFVIWDSTNSSTRSVTAQSLAEYMAASVDISTCIQSLRIDNNILYATQLNGTETQIGALS